MADQLLGVLESIRGTFSLGLFSWALAKDRDTQDLILSHEVSVLCDRISAVKSGQDKKIPAGAKVYDVTICGPNMEPDFEHLTQELSKMLLRNFTGDCFEAVKDYCEVSGQLEAMKRQPWYQFARLVRNCLTHTQCWKFSPYDLSLLPVTWNDKTFDASLQGKESEGTVYNWFDACGLYAAMFDFAKTLR
jgi:hypothetical protein